MPASMLDQVRMMREWAPLLGYGRRYVAATDPHERSLVVADMIEWAASRTPGKLDDRLAGHVVAILKTQEGEALVRDLLSIVEALPQQ